VSAADAIAGTPGLAVAGRRGVAREALDAGRVVLAAAVALAALGVVVIYSSSSGRGAALGTDTTLALSRQLRFLTIGALVGWVLARARLETIRKATGPALVAVLVLLAVTLVLGRAANNSRRWITVLGFSVQASELLKLAVVAWLADRLAARESETAFGARTPLLALLAPVAIGAGLVLVQPDLGTALFVVAVALVVLALAGIRPTRIVPFALTVGPLLFLYGLARFAHVRKRLALFASDADPGGQVHEALVALGSGGLLGRGLGEGTQKLFYVPEANTDFIFAVIGEELGFVACAGVVLAFAAIAWFGRRVAWRARILGPHAYYLGAGAVFVIAFQALVNIAVVTGMVPTKGVSLPFVSLGGSNLVVSCACVGLVWNIARRTAAAAGDDRWS
jgi:cell division protein FtsW